MSNLPPGVTEAMIDRYFGPGPCDPCDAGDHGDCEGEDCRCDKCDEDARDDAAMDRYEMWKEDQMDPSFDPYWYDD